MTEEKRHGNRLRGFAAMHPDRQREIASRGGKAAHFKGTAHEFTSEEARRAGKKGGEATNRERRKNRIENRKTSMTADLSSSATE